MNKDYLDDPTKWYIKGPSKDELLYHIDQRIEELDCESREGNLSGFVRVVPTERKRELQALRDSIYSDTLNTDCPKCRDGFIMDLERGNRRCDCPKGQNAD